MTTKLYWLTDETEIVGLYPHVASPAASLNGAYIVYHEDMYHLDGLSFALLTYPIFWMLLVGRFWFGIVHAVFQRLPLFEFHLREHLVPLLFPFLNTRSMTVSPLTTNLQSTSYLFKQVNFYLTNR
jgi:hypothetical protein